MDVGEVNTSLGDMINLSSSETEDRNEIQHPFKRTKASAKAKQPQSKIYKKTQKYRVRRSADRFGKALSKRPTKSAEATTSEAAHLLPAVDVLEKYNFKYEIKPNLNKQHEDLFLQDSYMSSFFKHYPEYICVDLLCEIVELELNLYLFISMDPNGHCEIIGLGLFKSSESGLSWFCEVFKKHNLNWRKIRIILCDRKARTTEIIKDAFPERLVLISFFHAMKTLKKDLLNLDYKMTNEEMNGILQVFEQMIFAPDESSYAELLKNLKSMPPAISAYFRKMWHQKKDSWALIQHINSKVLLKSFNVYLNLIRKTLRPLISTLDSLENVINILCLNIDKMRLERFRQFTSLFHTSPSLGGRYSKLLTSYAVELIAEQINASVDVKNVKKLGPGKYICSDDIVTINSCSCSFSQLFTLPCAHIFCVRKCLSLTLFAESLYSVRWLSSNYEQTFLELHTVAQNSQSSDSFRTFEKYFKLSSNLWSQLVFFPENIFEERLFILRSIVKAWKHDIKISYKISDIQPQLSTENNVQNESNDYWKEMYGISLKDILDSDNDISSFSITL